MITYLWAHEQKAEIRSAGGQGGLKVRSLCMGMRENPRWVSCKKRVELWKVRLGNLGNLSEMVSDWLSEGEGL